MGEAKKEEQARQELIDLGASTTKTARGTIYTLTIIGQIEGHQALPENIKTTKYEHVIPLLAAVEESEEIDGLLLLLNTVGGDGISSALFTREDVLALLGGDGR